MPEFRAVDVDDPVARELLAEYFDHRRRGFAQRHGYRVVSPDARAFSPPRGVFYVVIDGDEVAGCGGMRMLDADRGEIKHLWLREPFRGHGWGRALLTALEGRARDLGATRVVLDTNETLAAAQALYRAAGYHEVAPYNDNPNATHWFEKTLTAATPQ